MTGYSRGRHPVTVVEPEGAEAHPQKIIRGGRVVFNRVTTYSSQQQQLAFMCLPRLSPGPALPQPARGGISAFATSFPLEDGVGVAKPPFVTGTRAARSFATAK